MTNDTFNNIDFRNRVERILLSGVSLPGQYIGGEFGSVVKNRDEVRGRFCFAFPDVYTIGMSNYGLQLLYSIMNNHSGWFCERVFTPYPDMELALRREGLPLYSLETFTPLYEFDVLGFTLQYEMSFTNVLTILDLGGVPIHCRERTTMSLPLVIAGGPSASNPEPMSDFIDLFLIGDGEELLPEVCESWLELKMSGRNLSRREALLEVARRFKNVVAPSFYSAEFRGDLAYGCPRPIESGLPGVIYPAIIDDINRFEPPIKRIVPIVECVHDRVSIEVMRGCPGRCKFCVSTMMKRPIRIRDLESIVRIARESVAATGSDEVSLLSLSTSDYPQFDLLASRLREELLPFGVSISVPSLRVNSRLRAAMQNLTTERTSGLTIAPEAARDEMRRKIGKPITNEDLLMGCESAFLGGFNRVKMYFLCGLPEESVEDIDGIIDLSVEVMRLGKRLLGRSPVVTTNVSNFVPKPHSTWERAGMQTREYFSDIHNRLLSKSRRTGISLKYHTLETSLLEALMCRSDRRIGRVIERAWRLGARLDAWTDHFRYDYWTQAIEESGIDVDLIVHKAIPDNAELSWGYVRF
ncbi:MAG: TIGR03960 family B12-binding radical SAM protein [Planctomycetaceae bacterium]|nr:TIGR03960 family B12-binding radical SAM protein [Planctomycetaceae bacterium]